jgi:hypothetical protein
MSKHGHEYNIEELNIWYRKRAMEGDLAFKLAMICAVKAGLEHCIFGVVKDRTPIPPSYAHYDRAPEFVPAKGWMA